MRNQLNVGAHSFPPQANHRVRALLFNINNLTQTRHYLLPFSPVSELAVPIVNEEKYSFQTAFYSYRAEVCVAQMCLD